MSKEILYRGGEDNNPNFLWLSTSKSYASQYGDVKEYKISIDILDNLCDEHKSFDYVIADVDEYPLYETDNLNIDKMKADGYSGYYYIEDEYNCINVCLFK